MLLSHFAKVHKNDNICDLGCGNGAISILLCARHKNISVTGIVQISFLIVSSAKYTIDIITKKLYNSNINILYGEF